VDTVPTVIFRAERFGSGGCASLLGGGGLRGGGGGSLLGGGGLGGGPAGATAPGYALAGCCASQSS